MSTGQRIVLFDLFGVIALHRRPGAQAVGMTGHVFTGLGGLVKVVNIWLPTSTASPRLSQR